MLVSPPAVLLVSLLPAIAFAGWATLGIIVNTWLNRQTSK